MEEILIGDVGPDDDSPGIQFASDPVQAVDLEAAKKLAVSIKAGSRKLTSLIDVMDDDEEISFVVEDLLPSTGMLYLGGLSGTGKTILAIQMSVDIVLGRQTMTWKLGDAAEGIKCLMLSLEMGKKEFQLRLKHMYPNLTDDERKILHERYMVYTDIEPIELWNPIHVLELMEMIEQSGARLLLIDSASVSFASSLKDDKQVNESTQNLYKIRNKYDVAIIVVAHTRKPPPGIASNPEDATLNELFGHSGVAQTGSSIIIMIEDEESRKKTIRSGKQDEAEKLVHIINVKSRFGATSGAFKAHLTSKNDVENGDPLMFKRRAIPIAPMSKEKRDELIAKSPDLNDSLREAFSPKNLGSFLDDEEDDDE